MFLNRDGNQKSRKCSFKVSQQTSYNTSIVNSKEKQNMACDSVFEKKLDARGCFTFITINLALCAQHQKLIYIGVFTDISHKALHNYQNTILIEKHVKRE